MKKSLFYPIYWNQNFYSGLGYLTIKSSEHEDLGLGDNNNAITIDRREFIRCVLSLSLIFAIKDHGKSLNLSVYKRVYFFYSLGDIF